MSTRGYGGYPARPADLKPIRRGIVEVSGLPKGYQEIFADFERNVSRPFTGLTTDGVPHPELYPLQDTGLSTGDIAANAREFLESLAPAQRSAATRPVDSDRWRAWINAFAPRTSPPHGILLDDLSQTQRDAAMAILRAALSERGHTAVRDAMRTNAALAEIAGGYEDTLREYMYWFTVFGEPSATSPWGFQMYGHHCCLNVFVVGGQVTVGPMFLGAEPRTIEEGVFAGIRSFDDEMSAGLALMGALSPEQQGRACLARSLTARDLPPELQHPTEGRMRGSAARDNAIVPYEGVSAAEMDADARALLRSLIHVYVGRLRDDQAAIRLRQVEDHLDQTFFAWAGEQTMDRPFYYKVHSPVLFLELDAHHGMFIGNDDPEPFHIHTIMRVPNGNDYGRAWLEQATAADGAATGRVG